MRLFVTGAAGFIGAHVTRALLRRGHAVVALVGAENSMWRLQDVVGQLAIISGRLGDRRLLRRALSELEPESCIHLAWYTEPGVYLHSTANISCLTESLDLLRDLIEVGCRQVIMAGTCAEYDTELGYLREDTPTRPETLYAAAKLSTCLLGQRIAAMARINFAWARIFYPFGPQEDQRRLVPAAIRALQEGRPFPATKGEQVRDYIFIEDVAEAFCLLAEKQANGVANVSSGKPVTVRHLLEMIGNLMGRVDLVQFGSKPYRAWEPRFICGDNQRLKSLGWRPHYTLDQGLLETIRWWNKPATVKDE